MTAEGGREDMRIVEGRVGAHKQVIGLRRIEHHIEGRGSRTTNRSRRKTRILIGVVRRIQLEVRIEHTAQFEIAYGIHNRRVSLKEHAFLDAVEVEAGDDRQLVLVAALALDDRSDDGYLDR